MACSKTPGPMLYSAHSSAALPVAQAAPAAVFLGGSVGQVGRPSPGVVVASHAYAQQQQRPYPVASFSSGHGLAARPPAQAPGPLSHSSKSQQLLHQHAHPLHHHVQQQVISQRQASHSQVSSPGLPTRLLSHAHTAGAPPPQVPGRQHRHTQAHPGMQIPHQPHYMHGSVVRSVSQDQLTPRFYVATRAPQENGVRVEKMGGNEHPGSFSNIIRKFEQAMSREAESTRSTSLQELDEVTTVQLANIGETEVSANKRGSSVLCSSTTSLRTGGLLSRSATTMSMPLTVRSPRGSQRGPRRQASGPSLKAVAMTAVGGTPGSPRGSGWPSVMRSASASGLGLGPFDRRTSRSRSPSVSEPGTPINQDVSTISESKHAELTTPWEQYKNAARRAKLLQHQLAVATAEASRAAAVVRAVSTSVAEEVPDSGRSVPDSAQSAGASSSGGSVGSRRLPSGRWLTPRGSGADVAACDLQQQSLQEDKWGEQREEEPDVAEARARHWTQTQTGTSQ